MMSRTHITVGVASALALSGPFTPAGILSQDEFSLILGVLVLLITGFIGRRSDHRTFTHSLFFVILISFGFFCITEYLLIPTFIGGISHLVIDTFNKKPVPWLYPLRKKGFCFNICYASKTGNTILMWLGLVMSVILAIGRVSAIM